MKKYIIPLIIIILALGFSWGKPSSLDLAVTRLVLPNGLTVIIHEKHDLPLVAIKAMVKTGSLYEPEEKAGLASFVANLLRRGTKTKSAEEIAAQIEFVGGKLSAYSRRDRSYAVCEILNKDLDLGLEILSDILINPAFNPKEVEKERALLLAQISSKQDEPMIVGKMAYDDLIYGKHPYHRPVLGYTKTVKGISCQDLFSFHNKYYLPNNMVLAVVGDIDSGKVIRKIEDKFMKWERRPLAFPRLPSVMAQTTIKRKTIFMKKEQTHILLGNLGIKRNNPDYYALLVLDEILGGDLSARIFYNLRDRLGLAYSAYASITASAGQEPGEFLAYIAVSPFNTGKAIKGLLSEIERIRNEPVTLQEIEDAKNYLTGSYYFDFQSNRDFADYLLFCENYGLGFDYLKKYPGYIQAVKVSDLQKVAQKYLHPRAYSVVLVGP
jgi:zinc protease